MEITSQKLVSLADKRFSEVLTDGFKLFLKSYGTLILPLAFFQIVLIILDIFILTDIRWQIDSLGLAITEIMEKLTDTIPLTESEWSTLSYFLFMSTALIFLQNLIGAIIITIAMCSVSNYAFNKYMNNDVNFIESFKSAFNKRMFLVVLIIGVCLPLSALLLVVPAILIFGFFIFLIFTYNMEGNKSPIFEARAIAKGSFWKIIGVFIFNVTIIFVISYFINVLFNLILNLDSANFIVNFSSWYNPMTRNYGMIILYQLLINLADIFLAPLFICLLTVLFSSSKARKELGYRIQKTYYPVRELYQESYPQQQTSYEIAGNKPTPKIQIKEKFYCPFCGLFIQKVEKNFCPKCGESLSFIRM
ncbi:MAG: hypothetical protein ACFFDN_20100 [Candidatus Hodarchaeota archaeon]